jgi:F-type H+-transporting ATPase subunit b
MDLVNLSSLLIQSVNLAVIIFVLWKFVFSPYLRYLDEEAKKRAQLESQLQKTEYIVKEAHNQAENIIDQSRVDAKMIASEITENARKEATEIVTKAHSDADVARSKGFADVAHERKLIIEELKGRVVDVALKMNEKLF